MATDKLIVSAAVTGSWPTREQTPYVPITPEEIAASSLEAWREGAAIVHIHVRGDDGKVTCERERYERVVRLIRDSGSDVIINLSTGGGGGTLSYDERLTAIQVGPEIASFDAGSCNFGDRIFTNPPEFLDRMAKLMKERGVKPEIECFESGMIRNALDLAERGLIAKPYWFQFVLGVRGAAPATPRELMHMVGSIPTDAPWSACGIARHQLLLGVMAIAMGGHARTGMEDNIYYGKGELATSNAQLVARVVRIGRECGREPASPDEAREILGLVKRQ